MRWLLQELRGAGWVPAGRMYDRRADALAMLERLGRSPRLRGRWLRMVGVDDNGCPRFGTEHYLGREAGAPGG